VEPSLHRVMGPWLLLLFIVGDILGTGIYALTGQVAKQVGGVVWLPFLVAFAVALVTAFSYLELVTKYPRAAGAALYTHKAFGIHFITFIVAFAVMCSGITSASTASRAFAANLSSAFNLGLGGGGVTLIALGFMAVVAIVNFRGVGESVKANVVLTLVELTGLLIIICIGLWAIGMGQGDVSRVVQFGATDRGMFWSVIAATTLAFFAMVGFEDSVNMAEAKQVGGVPALGGTTALLLLCVFTVVNVAVLVLRRDPVEHSHFRTPTFLPVLGAVTCAFLAGPWTGRNPEQYAIAGVLLAIGVGLWIVTVLINRATGQSAVDPEMEDLGRAGPVN
jgi:amino acid transporter